MLPTGGRLLAAPTALFVLGTVDAETDRIANPVLDVRPGLLIVIARR